MPRCSSPGPDGWMDGRTDTDGRTDGHRWMDAAVYCRPRTLNVAIVAALATARAFAVFKNYITSESIKHPTSGHTFKNKSF